MGAIHDHPKDNSYGYYGLFYVPRMLALFVVNKIVVTLPYSKADKSGRKGNSSSDMNHYGLRINM